MDVVAVSQVLAEAPTWLRRRHEELSARLINLAAVLAEEAEEEGTEEEQMPELPEQAIYTWTEDDVRNFYRTKGREAPAQNLFEFDNLAIDGHGESSFSLSLPGGTVKARNEESHAQQRQLSSEDIENPPDGPSYFNAVTLAGLELRQDGLFPHNDPVLTRLSHDPHMKPFEKHLLDEEEKMCSARKSWASGNCAAKHGLDLRCFIDERFSREDTVGARLRAVVRFGNAASIGNGLSAHGGAIETALDEATAELAKATQGVMCYTTSANFQLKQKVDLHTTYEVECEVTKVGPRGLRIFIEAAMKDHQGQPAALCSVQLANMAKVPRRRN
jgi:acyl-CoA hydrolase